MSSSHKKRDSTTSHQNYHNGHHVGAYHLPDSNNINTNGHAGDIVAQSILSTAYHTKPPTATPTGYAGTRRKSTLNEQNSVISAKAEDIGNRRLPNSESLQEYFAIIQKLGQ